MRPALLFKSVMALLAALCIAGCFVSTNVQTDWKDPTFQGAFRKVLVVCLAKEMLVRNSLEDDFVAQFAKRGVVAVPSYTIFPTTQGIEKEMVKDKVREINADGVLLIRPIEKGSMDMGQNPARSTDFVYYDSWGGTESQNFLVPNTDIIAFYRVETSLFESVKGKVVWQAVSDTFEDGPWRKTLTEFARIMVTKLIERGLI